METYQLKHKGEEIDAILDKAKAADPLEDLAEIREGASKGATAVRPEEIEPLATKVELSDAVQGLKEYADDKGIETFNNALNEAKAYTNSATAELATKNYVDEAVANAGGGGTDEILQIIEENELVTATALNDLNDKKADKAALNDLDDRKADKAFVTDAIASAITTTLNTEV